MAALSTTPFGQAWLAQFTGVEQDAARRLIDEIMLVSRDDLQRGLRQLIERVLDARGDPNRPAALYAERKVAKDKTGILPLFPGAANGRATGPGVPPIVVDDDQEVGSEGVIANLITDVCRLRRNNALSHPGPDTMRERKAGPIVIVADFIGSGDRIWRMLEAFRKVATLRSWRSLHLIEFVVVAYSGTEMGVARVKESKLKPTVLMVTGAPTLWDAFRGPELTAVRALCQRYPKGHRNPLGYLYTGALIAFAHGMPNNAPAILHSTRAGWTPLFRNRSAAAADFSFPDGGFAVLAERASEVLRIRLARGYLDDPKLRTWVYAMLVLLALDAGVVRAPQISARTRLSLQEVDVILGHLTLVSWVTKKNTLTPLGRRELARLQRRRHREATLPSDDGSTYYPSQLRAR